MERSRIILMIEDNPDDVELTCHTFKKNRIPGEIMVLKNGVEVQDYFNCTGRYQNRDKESLPDLILLDLKLPKVDGLDVLRWIRADEHTKSLPVIILSASENSQDVVDGYTCGADCFLPKPIDTVQFSHAARQLGLDWLAGDISRSDTDERQ